MFNKFNLLLGTSTIKAPGHIPKSIGQGRQQVMDLRLRHDVGRLREQHVGAHRAAAAAHRRALLVAVGGGKGEGYTFLEVLYSII